MMLLIVHDEENTGIGDYKGLCPIKKVHSQIEFSIIKGSYNYVDLTSRLANADVSC